ncbi:MAG TPA: hypothetical protein VG013_36070 [Gemmataceae bacterium]|jgi:hypothetical protein|nr:hypothetical protein [Gemmataceae bacterium]
MRVVFFSGVALVLAVSAAAAAKPAPAAPKNKEYTGKVVPLAGLLEKFGARLDREAASQWLALVTNDGTVYPLIRDDGSRMFFKDARLLNRPMRLTGRLYKETHLLQVVTVRSLIKGKLHEVYYWCDICRIKRYEKKNCECCGAPMELREEPVEK